ncbi:MAG: hypothetical protein ACREJC_07140 [Tepidisphaeraceae bacterium]
MTDDDESIDDLFEIIQRLLTEQKSIKATLDRLRRELREEGYGEDEDQGD